MPPLKFKRDKPRAKSEVGDADHNARPDCWAAERPVDWVRVHRLAATLAPGGRVAGWPRPWLESPIPFEFEG
jgi:hypothetical protein